MKSKGLSLFIGVFLCFQSSFLHAGSDMEVYADDAKPDFLSDLEMVMTTIEYNKMVNGRIEMDLLPKDKASECEFKLDNRRFFDSARTANSYLVNNCITFSDMEKRFSPKTVDHWNFYTCEEDWLLWIDFNHMGLVNYNISKKKDGIHLSYKIRFDLDDDISKKRGREMIKNARTCANGPMKDVWARYGISLDIDIDSNRSKTGGAPNQSVDLINEVGRSDTKHFYYKGQNYAMKDISKTCDKLRKKTFKHCMGVFDDDMEYCEKFIGLNYASCEADMEANRQDEFCLMFLHEAGHHLGLPDEYPESNCPDRRGISTEVKPYSVMNQTYMGWDSIEFFPRHIRTILRGYCMDI